MRHLSRYLVFLTMVIACGTVTTLLLSAETPHGRVAGRLLAAETNTPLIRIPVSLVRQGTPKRTFVTSTRNDGTFAFSRIPAGTYAVVAKTHAHQQPDTRIEVLDEQTASPVLALKPVDPFLHVFSKEQAFTTREEVKFRCRGFTPVDHLDLTIYRIAPEVAVKCWHGWLPEKINLRGVGLANANLARVKELSLVQRRNLPITKRDVEGVFREEIVPGPLEPGMYLLALNAGTVRSLATLIITDLALVVKATAREALVCAADIQTGEPIAHATIEVREGDHLIARGTTDVQGMVSLALSGVDDYADLEVIGRYADSLAIASLYVYGSSDREPLRVYTYTDRPVYRPGQHVYFKSLIRKLVNNNYIVPPVQSAQLRVVDGSDNLIHSGQATTTAFGALTGDFALPDEALPGIYTLTVTLDGNRYDSSFSVAEYRKPEFTVTVTPDRKRCTRGENVSAVIAGEYFFGAPVAEAKVEYTVTRSTAWYYPEYSAWDADLADADEESEGYYGEGEIVTSGNGITDDNGRLTVNFTPQHDEKAPEFGGNDWRYTIHATLTDESARSEEGAAGVLVTQGDYRIDVTPASWLSRPEEPTGITVRVTDYDGKPVGGVQGEAVLSRCRWENSTERYGNPVRQTWQADAQGIAHFQVTADQDGDYRLQVQSVDGHRHTITEHLWLWVMSQATNDFSYPYQDLEVKADRNLYREGDTAKVMVNTKYAPQTALLTVEGPNILERRQVRLADKSSVISLKIRPDFLPYAQVSLCFIKNKQLVSGTTPLRVSREQKALNVEVIPDKPLYQPGDRATYRIRTRTTEGKPVQAEVSLGVVDEAIYTIERERAENILSFFYPKRDLQVQTAFSFPEVYLSGDDKSGATIRTRRVFQDTALWNPSVVTDSNGEASLSLTVPDNLTTWRATARAMTRETRVGQTTATLVVNKPFLVRLEAPRFLTQGDTVTLAAVAHNLTSESMTATIGLDAGALEVQEKRTVTRRIAAGKAQRIEWTAHVPNTRETAVRVWGKAAALDDAMELTLPVQPKGRLLTQTRSGLVTTREEVPLDLQPTCIPGTARLTVRLTPSLASTMLGSLDYLAHYPYGCAEQTMSSFLPDVAIARTLQSLNIDNPALRKSLPKMVQSGLLRLYGYQHEDGGWHWWENDETDPWMTAYVVYGLLQAKDAGYTVTPDVLERGINTLERLATSKEKTDINIRAYMAYVLALAGRTETAENLVRRFNASSPGLSDWGRAVLALTLHKLGRIAEGRVMLNAVWQHFSRLGYQPQFGEYETSSAECGALLLSATCALAPDDTRLPELVRWILDRRRENHWDSTRDTAFVLYGLSAYLRQTREMQPNLSATISINGRTVATHRFTSADLFKPEMTIAVPVDDLGTGTVTVAIEKTGTGSLYYAASLRQSVAEDLSVPPVTPTGLTISRSYRRVIAGEKAAARRRRQAAPSEERCVNGDTLEVTLKLHADRAYDYLMVEDMLPAGCEARDRGRIDPWEWEYWWCNQIVRDEKVGFAIRHLGAGDREITYRITASSPGQFTALPPVVYDMYRPEAHAEGIAQALTIRP